MKTQNILIILLVLILPDLSMADESVKPSTVNASQAMFVYKPPLRGAPKTRVGAGVRGGEQENIVLHIIAPEHTGLTLISQPTLYWYTENTQISRLEFALLNDEEIDPILEINLNNKNSEGFQRINLADYNITLKQGLEYQWAVASVNDDDNRSGDIVASGTIAMSSPANGVKAELLDKSGMDRISILAKEGIWYDAFNELETLINQQKNNLALKKARSDLLKQVGLTFASKY